MKETESVDSTKKYNSLQGETQFSRTQKLIGETSLQKLNSSKVALFGLGGVGSFVLEALARVGITNFLLIDNDIICESNINRQLFALHSTIGGLKTECAKKRILDINPNIKVTTYPIFFLSDTIHLIEDELKTCNYIIDAIDTVSAKILLIELAKKHSIPIISSMGTGNKMNPHLFEIADIKKTSVCPLARVMRRELKARNIQNVKVLYSKETPIKESPPASISFVPSVAGLLIASEVVNDLLKA